MPFKSEKQKKFLFANKPDIAKKWSKKYSSGKTEKLNKHKIEVIPLELRHDRIISGGFHCVTLDLSRKAK